MPALRALFVFSLATSAGGGLHAQSRPQPEAASRTQTDAFLAELTSLLRADDRGAVASRIAFPITVRMSGLRVPFASPDDLFARYDDVFTREMRQAVGRGDPNVLTIRPVGGRLKIVAIAVPQDTASHRAEEALDRRGAASAPRRIQIRAGPRPTQFSGNLGEVPDVYLLFLPKGQFVDIRLLRVGRAAIVRAVDARTGHPLNPRVAAGGPVVTGRAPAPADYRIEVVREAGQASGPLPYILSISAR